MALTLTQIRTLGHKLQTFRALRHRNFRWLWFNAASQAAAAGMQFFILGWLVLELSDSSSKFGLVFFLYGIPNLSFILFGGIFADRIDRRRLLIISQAAEAILILTLATLTITDEVVVWHIYATAFILGTVQALNMPSRMAIVANLVQREDMMNAVALNSVVMNTGRIIGPAVAGGIIELAGIGTALYLNAGCYCIGTGFLLLIRGMSHQKSAEKTNILRDLMVGLHYSRSTPAAFTVIGMTYAFGFFGMPYIQVMPAFAKEVLEVGAAGAGLLITAAGVGSLLGNLALASLGDFPRKGWLLLGAIFTFCLSLFLFAWSPAYWVSWAILWFVGMGSTSYISMATTVLQLTAPPEVHGRMLSILAIGASLMYLGSLPMALVAGALNWPAAVAIGASLPLIVALGLGVWRPTLRHLKV